MDRSAVRELARRIVEQAAPDELPGFDTQADAWFEDPVRARVGDAIHADPLGSGLATVFNDLAPAALFIAHHVLSAGVDMTIEAGGRSLFRKFRGRKTSAAEAAEEPGAAPIDVSAVLAAYGGDLEKVRSAALTAAAECGGDTAQAELIANVVVAVLSPGRVPPSVELDQGADE